MESTPPVGSGSSTGSEGAQDSGLPPIPKGFQANPEWVAFFMKMFPNCGAAEAAAYAAAFQNNMMQMISHQIQQLTAQQKIASQYMKDVIEGNE